MTHVAANFVAQAPVSLEEIARREGISQGYLEEIANSLRQANLIEGRRGQGGGYVLPRAPKKIRVSEIFEALEGPVTIVDCLADEHACPSKDGCSNIKLWKRLQARLAETLNSVTLDELIAPHYIQKA